MTAKSHESSRDDKKSFLKSVITDALNGKVSSARDSLSKLLHDRAVSAINEEKNRVSNMIFDGTTEVAPSKKVPLDEGARVYSVVRVSDPGLFSREQKYMPSWLSKATPEGIKIDPVTEEDAIAITTKFGSVEFSEGKAISEVDGDTTKAATTPAVKSKKEYVVIDKSGKEISKHDKEDDALKASDRDSSHRVMLRLKA